MWYILCDRGTVSWPSQVSDQPPEAEPATHLLFTLRFSKTASHQVLLLVLDTAHGAPPPRTL